MKKKQKKNKSEIVIAVVGLAIIAGAIFLFKNKPVYPVDNTPKEQTQNVSTPITITEENIKEDNFTGTKSVIKGSGPLAENARAYIDETLTSFKQSADVEVPPMRAQFGADSPTANYEINLKATYLKNTKTNSIIIDQYVYTGGANGNDSYKVFTASASTGEILSLADVILPSQQTAFTAFIKKELNNWRPEGSKEPVIFPEDVKALTFDSFTNWSYNGKNLIIYFDKYEVGPGVLGAIAFPLPVSKIKGFLVAGY